MARIQSGLQIPIALVNKSLGEQSSDKLLLSVRKVDTAVICSRMVNSKKEMKCPITYTASPNFDEIDLFLSDAPSSKWIYKPDGGTGGAGMLISTDKQEIAQYARDNINEESRFAGTNGRGGVIQEIMKDPLLIEGRRFSLRIHAFVIQRKGQPLAGYFSANAFHVLFAGEPVSETAGDASIISNVHFNTDFVNTRTQYTLLKHLANNGMLDTWRNKTLRAIGIGLGDFLQKEGRGELDNPFQRFEVYGCDVLLDNSLTPWLLECNRCAGVRSFLIARNSLYEEFLYLMLYSYFINPFEVPHLQYWQPMHQKVHSTSKKQKKLNNTLSVHV